MPAQTAPDAAEIPKVPALKLINDQPRASSLGVFLFSRARPNPSDSQKRPQEAHRRPGGLPGKSLSSGILLGLE